MSSNSVQKPNPNDDTVDSLIVAEAQPATEDIAFQKQFTHHRAEVNGVRLHYVMGGNGYPVVLLHGYPETWYAWRKIMPALADRYTVIAPDMRGLGDSSKPATGYDKRTVAEDIHQLMEHLGIEQYFLVGHDMGGPVAYALAAAYPEQVRKVVFLECAVPGFGLEQAMDVSQGGLWHFGFFMAPKFPEMLTAGREKQFLTEFAFKSEFVYQKNAISDAEIDEYVRCYAAPGGMKAGFEYYRAFLEDAAYNRAHFKDKLPMAVLALGGEKCFGDAVFRSMQAIATNVSGSVIKDCSHFISEEQPEELVRQLITFFEAE